MLDEYPPESLALRRRVVDLRARLDLDERMTFVLSVNATSRLVDAFKSLGTVANVVIVCNTSNEPPQDGVVSLAHIPVDRYTVRADLKCEYCDVKQKIGIDNRTYERLPSLQWKGLAVTPQHATKGRQFWEYVDKASAVRLHTDEPYAEEGKFGARHHAVYLDMPALLRTEFRDSCAEKLRTLTPPDVVLLPDHGTTQQVSDLVTEIFPRAHQIRIAPGPFPKELGGDLTPASRILVADDTLVTGKTIMGFRREIYRLVQPSGRSPAIEAFVIVSRPTRKQQQKNIARPYRDAGGVRLHEVEYVPLPAAGHMDCPWCDERQAMATLLPDLQSNQEYGALRLAHLSGDRTSPLLLGTEEDGDNSGLVTVDSFFGDLHQTTAFAAVSSACLRIREEEFESPERGNVNVINVSAAIDAFFESIILAAILRTFVPRELRWPGHDPDIAEAIARCDTKRLYPGTAAELLYAAVRGKLPRSAVDTLRKKVDMSPAVDLLNRLFDLDTVNK